MTHVAVAVSINSRELAEATAATVEAIGVVAGAVGAVAAGGATVAAARRVVVSVSFVSYAKDAGDCED